MSRIEAIRIDKYASLQASGIITCSNLMASWVQVQPLGHLLGQAINGGELLNVELWHPFKPPTYHNSQAVAVLYKQLREAWESVIQQQPVPEDDWYGVQIRQIIDLFSWASPHNEAIVSFLEPPEDETRAKRVLLPKLT
jgi:hypothetical protein